MIEEDYELERLIHHAEINLRNARRNEVIATINMIVAVILFCWVVYTVVVR